MSDPSNTLRLEVVGVLRSRRHYDPVTQQRLVEACRQPGALLAGLALRHGVNANLLRKWLTVQPRQQRPGKAVDASERATEAFVPVVALCGVADPPDPSALPSLQYAAQRGKAAHNAESRGPRLTVEMPNGVTLRLECSGRDVELMSAMIVTLKSCRSCI